MVIKRQILIIAVAANLVAFAFWLAEEYSSLDLDFRLLLVGSFAVVPACGLCFWSAFKKRQFALLIPAGLGLWAISPFILILVFGLVDGGWH